MFQPILACKFAYANHFYLVGAGNEVVKAERFLESVIQGMASQR